MRESFRDKQVAQPEGTRSFGSTTGAFAPQLGEASLVELRVGGELCADQKQLIIKKTKL